MWGSVWATPARPPQGGSTGLRRRGRAKALSTGGVGYPRLPPHPLWTPIWALTRPDVPPPQFPRLLRLLRTYTWIGAPEHRRPARSGDKPPAHSPRGARPWQDAQSRIPSMRFIHRVAPLPFEGTVP